MKELFIDIEGYEGRYQISNQGRVKSLPKPKQRSNKILKINYNPKSNYSMVSLYLNSTRVAVYVHRLVAQAFLGTWNPNLEVNHIDGDKTDNTVENLEMVTRLENVHHSILNRLTNQKGIHNTRAAFNSDEIKIIRSLYNSGRYNQSNIGRIFGVAQTTISKITRGLRYKV